VSVCMSMKQHLKKHLTKWGQRQASKLG
jgi:hypothetical protein